MVNNAMTKGKQIIRGSITVEAILTFSTVFIVFIILVYCVLIMYEYAALQSAASEACQQGAYIWVSSQTQETYVSNSDNLYWRILDSQSDEKATFIEKLSNQKYKYNVIAKLQSNEVEIKTELLQKKLHLKMTSKYRLPLSKLFGRYGLDPILTINAYSVCSLDDNAEFIRNMDMVTDIGNSLLNSDNRWIGEGTKANEIINKLIRTNK